MHRHANQQPRRTRSAAALRLTVAVAAALSLPACGRDQAERAPADAPLALRAPTLAEALSDLPHDRPFVVSLETDIGSLRCELDPTRTPHAVALFVGLATGRATFLDPTTRQPLRRPMYRDLPFQRAVPGMLIQSGDPVGDSSGNPGYRIAVEASADDVDRLTQPGALVLARYTSPPGRIDPQPPPKGLVLGSQFAVLLSAMPHLAGQLSVIGRCNDLQVAQRIADDIGNEHVNHRLLRVAIP